LSVATSLPIRSLHRAGILPPGSVRLLVADTVRTQDEPTGPPRSITVTVEGFEGVAGRQLAGVLYTGFGISDPEHRAIGGLAASVDADPFTTTPISLPNQNLEIILSGSSRKPKWITGICGILEQPAAHLNPSPTIT
jgi:hypothetical protein